jgi:hypothetical protein
MYASQMEQDRRNRARARQSGWTWGIAGSHDELDEADLRFWRRATPSQRFNAVLEINRDIALLRESHEPASGLRGSVGGVRGRRS